MISVRLPYREPFDGRSLIAFLERRAVPGIEEVLDGVYRRSVRLAHGPAVIELSPGEGFVQARFHLPDDRDLDDAVARSRLLLDLDCDPEAVLDVLGSDQVIGPLARAAPGRRVPGHVDGHELAVRAVLGQQVSLGGAATLAGRLVARYGEALSHPVGTVTHLFPAAEMLARAEPRSLAMPGSRRRALIGLAAALASGEIALERGEDPRARLLALPGIGPWTVEYVAMRALGDRDAFMPTDLGIKRALAHLGLDPAPRAAAELAERWRPFRAYAMVHLWESPTMRSS